MSLIWIVNILSVFFLCVFFAGIVIPQILLIAFRRRLFDEPDERKIHQCVVPRLGGMTFIWFHQYLYAMLAFATLGVLIPFYYYKEIYIETERIIIRNFKQKDAEGLLEYLSHPRVNCFAGDRLCSREAAWAYMQYSPKDMLRYAVSLKKDDFIIGDVFALRENEDTYNVGWHFNKRFEGKGFACEAAAGLLDYLFREAGARRIYGFVEDDNIRSKRLCERLGMRREGCFKEFVTFVNNPDGSPKYEDTCVYAILEKEWNTIRQW